MWGTLIREGFGVLVDGVASWRKSAAEERVARTEVRKAEIGVDLARYQAEANRVQSGQANEHEWEMAAATQASRSWKDEWWTILLSLPLIMAFIPGGAKYVEEGFRVIERMPEWYVAYVGAAVAFAFGIRHLVQLAREAKRR